MWDPSSDTRGLLLKPIRGQADAHDVSASTCGGATSSPVMKPNRELRLKAQELRWAPKTKHPSIQEACRLPPGALT